MPMKVLTLERLPYITTDVQSEVFDAFNQKTPKNPYLRNLINGEHNLTDLLVGQANARGFGIEQQSYAMWGLRRTFSLLHRQVDKMRGPSGERYAFPALSRRTKENVMYEITENSVEGLGIAQHFLENDDILYFHSWNFANDSAEIFKDSSLTGKIFELHALLVLSLNWQLVVDKISDSRSKSPMKPYHLI